MACCFGAIPESSKVYDGAQLVDSLIGECCTIGSDTRVVSSTLKTIQGWTGATGLLTQLSVPVHTRALTALFETRISGTFAAFPGTSASEE